MVVLFLGVGLVLLPVLVRFGLFVYAIGPFIGTLIGQMLFLGFRQRRLRELHLGEPSNPFTSGLGFGERVVITIAMFVLVLAGSVAMIRVTHDAVSPCKDMSSLANTMIARAGRDGVGFGDGAAVELEKATSDVVSRQVSFAGAEPVIGTWVVRRDGALFPLDQVARDATEPASVGRTFGFGPDSDLLEKMDDARRCLG